jgi:RNA polymerase sigma-70 factor (ECF subfamily)
VEDELDRCLRGDGEAWEAFVRRYAPVISRAVAVTFARHAPELPAAEREDAVQDVFLRLVKDGFRLLRTYDASRSALTTWLTLVARSSALDRLRRRRPPLLPLADAGAGGAPPAAEPRDEGGLVLPPGVLTPRQELVLHLLFDKDMEVDDVAGLLGIDAQTVRSTKHKAVSALRRHFGVERE